MNITIETINVENLHMSRPVDIPPMERAFLSALIASAMSQDAPPADPPAFPEVPAIDGRPRADAANYTEAQAMRAAA